MSRTKPVLELRHSAKIEFNNSLSVNDKMDYFEKLRAEFGIVYEDIVSIDNSSNIIAEFEATEDIDIGEVGTPNIVTMYDRGCVEFYDSYMYIKTEFSFPRLVEIHDFTTTLLNANVKNMLVYHNKNVGGAPTA